MSSALRRSTRTRKGEQRVAASAERANDADCPLHELMAVTDYSEVLCEQLDYALLSRLRVSRAMRRWIDPLLELRGVEDVDVRAGLHVPLLRLLVAMEHRVVRLARGEYELTAENGEGNNTSRLLVKSEGASFVSMHLPRGMIVGMDGSLTMTKCTSTGEDIDSRVGGSLAMEDSRVYGSRSTGVTCQGDAKLTRCTVENNNGIGVFNFGRSGSQHLSARKRCFKNNNQRPGVREAHIPLQHLHFDERASAASSSSVFLILPAIDLLRTERASHQNLLRHKRGRLPTFSPSLATCHTNSATLSI